MELQFLLAGLLAGVLVSVGVGPITLLVVHRSLHKGWLFGVISGLGIAFSDVIYAILSRIGLVFLNDFITGYQFWFQLIISLLFIFIGVYIYFSHNEKEKEFHVKTNYRKNFFTAFVLNLINIINFLLFALVFAKLVPMEVHTTMAEVLLIVGIGIGAGVWRFGLSYILSHFKVNLEKIYILNRILGVLIFLGGIFTLAKLFL